MNFNFEHISDRDKETVIIDETPIILSDPQISLLSDDHLTATIRKDKIILNTKTYEEGNEFLINHFKEEQLKRIENILKTSKHVHFGSITAEIVKRQNKNGKYKTYLVKNIVEVRNDIYNLGQPNEYYPGIVIHKKIIEIELSDN